MRLRNPTLRTARAQRDAVLLLEIQRIWQAHLQVYGADKVWKQMNREGLPYVSTWQGWLYVAFVIDVFARRIVGWQVSSTMHTGFVLDALEHPSSTVHRQKSSIS